MYVCGRGEPWCERGFSPRLQAAHPFYNDCKFSQKLLNMTVNSRDRSQEWSLVLSKLREPVEFYILIEISLKMFAGDEWSQERELGKNMIFQWRGKTNYVAKKILED